MFKKIGDTEIYNLQNFTEKPDKETAQKFIASGNYLWNTGIYVWKTSVLLQKYKKFLPDTYQKLLEMMKDPQKVTTLYPTLQKISIDFAIMEKVDSKEVKIIKADLGWSDIGNFEALYKDLKKRNRQDKIDEFEKILTNQSPTSPIISK